jgi:hypothetical protein
MITYRLRWKQGKPNALSHHLYLVPNKGDIVYDQHCNTILKFENLQLQTLLLIHEVKTLF